MKWVLLALLPVSWALESGFHASPVWVFIAAIGAIIPLAEWMRQATEQLAARLGSSIGGLLNVTFGNMTELILALFVLRAGHAEVAKAQITGSIIGNSLLGLGLAVLVGSWGRTKQTFNREKVGLLSSLLFLSMIALLLPAFFDLTERGIFASPDAGNLDEKLSLSVSVVLIFVYVMNLIYTLKSHRNTFDTEDQEEDGTARWSLLTAVGVLLLATAATAMEAELVSGALEATAKGLGLSTFFLGIIVLAVVGNAAEYVAAVYFARQDRMGLAIGITVGATIQVALLTAPVLVIVSYFMGQPMNLVFSTPLELIAIAAVAFAVNTIAHDGETTWFEGVLLLAVYVLLALAFFYATPGGAPGGAHGGQMIR